MSCGLDLVSGRPISSGRGTVLSLIQTTVGAQTLQEVLATVSQVPQGTLLSIYDIFIRARSSSSADGYRQATAGVYFNDPALGSPGWAADFVTTGTFGGGPGGMSSGVGIIGTDLVWEVIGIAGVTLRWTFVGILRVEP